MENCRLLFSRTMQKLPPMFAYLFWLSWAFIVGGLCAVALLAPLAFFTLPPLTSDSRQAVIISGKLLTLFFSRFIPLCALAFWILTVLEMRHLKNDWHTQAQWRFYGLCSLLVVANGLWVFLAFGLIPEMKEAVMHTPSSVGLGADSALFRKQHQWANGMILLALVLTLCLPYFRLTRPFQKPEALQLTSHQRRP